MACWTIHKDDTTKDQIRLGAWVFWFVQGLMELAGRNQLYVTLPNNGQKFVP